MEQKVLTYLASGKSLHQAAVEFGILEKEAIAIYVANRAKG